MSRSAVLTSVRRLRSILAGQQGQEQSDEQLLSAFAEHRDEMAFAALVRRHGPMVLGVCRRVLGHEQDAEDAFQATFLVLARRAAALREKTAVASFLHGTASHLASTAKRAAGRRRKYEGALGALTQPRSPASPADELSWREVRTYLDEEIARLPEKYRSVFVLCCLESVGRAEAARRLGVKEGTLSSRLAEARKRLSRQLARRGVELTAVLAAAAMTTPTVSAALMASTMRAAAAASGDGLVSASVAELVHSATMMGKPKIVTGVLLTVTLLGGAGVCFLASPQRQQVHPLLALRAGEKTADTARSTKREATKAVEIQGRVLGPDGKPKAGATLLLFAGGDKPQQLGTTAADGSFRIALKEPKWGILIAQAAGCGLDFLNVGTWKPGTPVEFRLVKDQVIRGRVVSTEGKPVAGARVSLHHLGIYPNNSLDSFLIDWKKRHPTSGMPTGVKDIWSRLGTLFDTMTDADGRFVLHGLGVERFVALRVSGAGIADDEVWIANRPSFDPTPYNQAVRDKLPSFLARQNGRGMFNSPWLLHGPEPAVIAESEKILRGVVKAEDTGTARPGVEVRVAIDDNGLLRVPVEASTDAQGRYEIRGARKARRYQIKVASDVAAGYLNREVWVADAPGYQPITTEITVQKGVIITGKMIDGATGKPIGGNITAAPLLENPYVKGYPGFTWYGWQSSAGDDGTFRVLAIPGPMLLMAGPRHRKADQQFKPPTPDPKYPKYFSHDPVGYFYGPEGTPALLEGNYCKVLEIKPDAKVVEQDIVLERASVLPVRIQDTQGKPLAGVWVAGSIPRDWSPAIRCQEAECSAYQVEASKPRLMIFYHPGRKLAGTLTLKGDEKPPVVAKLGPAGSIKGQLLDTDGNPLAGVEIDVHYRQRVAAEIHKILHQGKQIVTDVNGVFALDDLIPEQKFELSFGQGKRGFVRTPKLANPAIEVKAGESRDVGAIKLKRIVEQPGG